LAQHAYHSTRDLVTRCCTICHCNEHKRSKLGHRSKKTALNAKTEQFTTANISGNALKQGSRTHSSLRQISSQLLKTSGCTSVANSSYNEYTKSNLKKQI